MTRKVTRNRCTGRWELTERVVVSGHLCTSRVQGRWAGGLGLELEGGGGWRGPERARGPGAGGLEGWAGAGMAGS